MIEAGEDEDLPDVSDSLFSICPQGGCEASLNEDERKVFRDVHEDLVTAVRVHEPLKRDLSAHPLVLQWVSPASGKQTYIVVAFNVRKPPRDMVMFQLEPLNGHNGLDCPFVLELESQHRRFSLQSLRSDMELCMTLAREASDWLLYLLKVGEITGAFASFQIVERAALDRHTLRRAAEEMKQVQRAAKAAKLAQGLTAIRKRKRRTQGKRKASQRPLAASAAQDISDADWASGSDSLTEDIEGADGSPSMPAGLGQAARRTRQSRAIPWGPFQLAPIVRAAGQTGWGAICGQHCDRGNALSCKKEVSRGSTLADAECILRLKRWLIAGCFDTDWPIHRQRSHHVELGGRGLQDFAEGMSEAEMDAMVESWR